jgi:hypothetical protein
MAIFSYFLVMSCPGEVRLERIFMASETELQDLLAWLVGQVVQQLPVLKEVTKPPFFFFCSTGP